MELYIGKNIKRLRQQKGLTQEQLGNLVGVSTAAVSKWESGITYPDITLLLPLASAFGASLDALVGYDEAKLEQQITKTLEHYRQLHLEGRFADAMMVIEDARKEYPQDYRVMDAYMWHKAGRNMEHIQHNRDELMAISEAILSGCDQEAIRLSAIHMQAKLLHAHGRTDSAMEVLSQLPGWGSSREQRTEQLFEKDTEEYRYWNRKNCYALMDAMANKLFRTRWYADGLTLQERVSTLEAMGDSLLDLCEQKGMEAFCIAAQMIYAELAGRLSGCGCVQDVIRIREKQFIAIRAMMRLARGDKALTDCLKQTYRTEDLLSWQIDWLRSAQHPQFVKLREDPDYREFLDKNS